MHAEAAQTLRSKLTYEPQELRFGTSGRRGEVVHLTQLEIYINALAELRYLQALPAERGGIQKGDEFYFAWDLRPSSSAFSPEQMGRGEIAQAIVQAMKDAGMQPVNLGPVPTPALAFYSLTHGRGSMMVTGSHIPFDRNGYKTYTATGELTKQDEEPIGDLVAQVREALYRQPFKESLFNESGAFKFGHTELPAQTDAARDAYIERYTRFFGDGALSGLRILVYQHSSVGRDLLVDILRRLGSEVIAAGRSETFVPIDTENVDTAMLRTIQTMVNEAAVRDGLPFAVVSFDGDADRPLVLGVDSATGSVRFIPGDLLGMLVAEQLEPDAVVVPISCNDAIDRGKLAPVLRPKTRIGSPYVIAGMEAARRDGCTSVCGWEPNGGFLTATDIQRNGRVLTALPTRDAVLPIVCVLLLARAKGVTVSECLGTLPQRFSRASLKRPFLRSAGLHIVQDLSPRNETEGEMAEIRSRLEAFFVPALGVNSVTKVNFLDGIRVTFDTEEVVHLRPSGNADEFRVYAVSDSAERADFLVQACMAEPDGVLRLMQRALS